MLIGSGVAENERQPSHWMLRSFFCQQVLERTL
jgi:hypothetical protein